MVRSSMFCYTDGKTSSKDGWQGDLGKLLATVSSLEREMVFSPIPGTSELPEMTEEEVKDLSSDQHFGFR